MEDDKMKITQIEMKKENLYDVVTGENMYLVMEDKWNKGSYKMEKIINSDIESLLSEESIVIKIEP